MARKQTILGMATAVALAGVVAVPAAANAADGDLYTWVHNPTGSDQAGFATISSADAALTFLGTNLLSENPELRAAVGAEVCDGVGYAVAEDGLDGSTSYAFTWDPTTGALLSEPVELFYADGEVAGAIEADTLADCTFLSLVYLWVEGYPYWTISEVDPTTGEVTPLVWIDWTPELGQVTGIATDPSGTTYLFGTTTSSPYDSLVATADLSTGDLGVLEVMEGLRTEFGDTFTHGIDFDANGVLWTFVGVYAVEQYHLASFAAGADLVTAVPTDHGPVVDHGEGDFFRVTYPAPLAAEGTVVPPAPPAPQLANTGAELPVGVLFAAGILLALGAAAVIRRRMADQGTSG